MKKIILSVIVILFGIAMHAQQMTTSEYNKLRNEEREFKLNGGYKTLLYYEKEAQERHWNTNPNDAAIKKLRQDNLQLKAELKALKKEMEKFKKRR